MRLSRKWTRLFNCTRDCANLFFIWSSIYSNTMILEGGSASPHIYGIYLISLLSTCMAKIVRHPHWMGDTFTFKWGNLCEVQWSYHLLPEYHLRRSSKNNIKKDKYWWLLRFLSFARFAQLVKQWGKYFLSDCIKKADIGWKNCR